MVYNLYANTEGTFTRLASGYVCTLVKAILTVTIKINKLGRKKGINFILLWSITAQRSQKQERKKEKAQPPCYFQTNNN